MFHAGGSNCVPLVSANSIQCLTVTSPTNTPLCIQNVGVGVRRTSATGVWIPAIHYLRISLCTLHVSVFLVTRFNKPPPSLFSTLRSSSQNPLTPPIHPQDVMMTQAHSDLIKYTTAVDIMAIVLFRCRIQ